MPVFGLPLIVVAVLLLRLRHRSRDEKARMLRSYGFGLMAFVGVFVALFIAGEAATDPGGWSGAGLIASWAAPLVGLGILAGRRPDAAVQVFVALTALILALSVWAAIDPRGWNDLENDVGPVRFVAAFALALPVAVLGRKRPTAAGLLLLTLSVAPVALDLVALWRAGKNAPPRGALVVLGSPWTVSGLFYLVAGRLTRPRPAPGGETETATRREAA